MTTAIITNQEHVPEFSKFMSALIEGGWTVTITVDEADVNRSWSITGVPAWSAAHPNAVVVTNQFNEDKIRIDLAEIARVEVQF